MSHQSIPAALTERQQWVCWTYRGRNGERTKCPIRPDGSNASSTDPATWGSLAEALDAFSEGPGFVFTADDPFCGVDLDGCRDPDSGELKPWAAKWVELFDSYTEVSPSGTGVKIFITAASPFSTGKKINLTDQPDINGKAAGVEVYDRKRFFCVTGQRLDGPSPNVEPRQEVLTAFCEHFFPKRQPLPRSNGQPTGLPADRIAERAAMYVEQMPPAISGQGGHNQTFSVACKLVLGFGLTLEQAWPIMLEYNARCEPPWSERELEHKLESADQQPGERGYLLQADRDDWAPRHRGHHYASDAEQQADQSEPEPSPDQFRIALMTSADLAAAEFEERYHVENVLAMGQPGIVGGRAKSLKTTLLVDLAVSVGTGSLFLGEFETEPGRVLMLSGESGKRKLQQTASRICEARGCSLADADVLWGFELPQLGHGLSWLAFRELVAETEPAIVVVDPAYLCLLTGENAKRNAANVFEMGPLLGRLTELGEKAEATVILCHHCRKGNRDTRYEPPELEDLSQSGFAEWARQWLLVGRREQFDRDAGEHRLWLNIGGSAGHFGLWAVDVDEYGPRWGTTVRTAAEAVEDAEKRRKESAERRQTEREQEHRTKIIAAFRAAGGKSKLTKNRLREYAGLSGQAINSTIGAMLRSGELSETTQEVNKRTFSAYRLNWEKLRDEP